MKYSWSDSYWATKVNFKAESKLLHSKEHFRMSLLALVHNGETLTLDYQISVTLSKREKKGFGKSTTAELSNYPLFKFIF